jgi:hypothetical protein
MADVVLIVEDLDSLIVSALCGAMIRPQEMTKFYRRLAPFSRGALLKGK